MKTFLKRVFNSKNSLISTNYDSYNHEVVEITNHNKHDGLRIEITKTILPFLQFTAIKTGDISQYFTTLSQSNSAFQFCFDSNRSIQLRASALAGPVIGKWHTIVTSQRQVYSQFETAYNSVLYNIGFKVISPSFQAASLIYILNYCRAFGRLCLGFEAVGMNNELGLSFSSRMENNNSIYCLSLQRFNLLAISFYRRINKLLELGIEIKRSSSFLSTSAGLRIRNYKSDVKINLDNRFNIGFNWDEKLSESLSFNFNATQDVDGLEYGIGFIYD